MMKCAIVPALTLCLAAVLAVPGSVAAQPSVATTDSAFIRQEYTKRVVRIPMRDGARLFTVVYAPRDAGSARRYPILLQRTPFSVSPYGEGDFPTSLGPDRYMLRDKYIFVAQEVRGRYMSEGTFENVRPLLSAADRTRNPKAVDEATDAHDTIEWLLANVAGNSGKVGLFGISYGGFYVAAAATSKHPAIVATSLQAPVMNFFFEDFHHNGALVQGHLFTFPIFGAPRPAPTAANWWLPDFQRMLGLATGSDYDFQLSLGALSNVTRRYYAGNTWWQAMVNHPTYDAFWRARAMPRHLNGITHPVLVVGGWFDAENLYGTLAAYRALRERSPKADVSLVMGPFAHRDWTDHGAAHTTHGHLYFGDSLAAQFQRDVEAPFFREHLKGETASTPSGALMFDSGRKAWMRFARWPAATSVQRAFYFHRDGSLSMAAPKGERSFVEYTANPLAPVPSRCTGPTIEDGALNGYMSDDQRCVTGRPDVAVFQSEALREDITFAGELTARIAFSTSGTDADVVVKLIDVYPPDEPNHPFQRDTTVRLAGYQQLVRGEIMRGRFRRSFSTPIPFKPGEITEVTVKLPDVFHTFRKGHRIMVHVQGSWFPLFDRNPGAFVPSVYAARDADFVRTTHRIAIGGVAGSHLAATVGR